MTATTTRPAFRAPWTNGALADYQADTFEALKEGAKRKRNAFDVAMPVAVAGHLPCIHCGVRIDTAVPAENIKAAVDGHLGREFPGAIIRYYPKTKTVTARHYECGWQHIFNQITALTIATRGQRL